jgi:CysZ protein
MSEDSTPKDEDAPETASEAPEAPAEAASEAPEAPEETPATDEETGEQVGGDVDEGQLKAPAPNVMDPAQAPEGWLPYSGKLGERCNTCGDLRSSPAGCPACSSELVGLKETLPERLAVKPMGFAPGEFFRGMSYLPRGAWFLLRNPRLWKYAIVPLLINMVVALLGLWGAIYLAQNVHEMGTSAMADWEGAWAVLAFILEAMLYLFEAAAVFVIPILLAWLLTAFPLGILYKLLFTPFMEGLGGATDRLILTGGKDRIEFQTSHLTILYTMFDAVFLGFLQGALIVLLLPLLLVPFLGSFVWMVLPPSIFASMDFSDIHLVRRGYTPGEKIRLWKTHKWRFFGYGASFFFFLTLPILNALAIPVATVGGAMLYLELDRK